MERAPIESLFGAAIFALLNRPMQLKQANEEIYRCQGGLMSSARGKDGALKKVNNIIQKSMFPLMRVPNKLYLADTTEAAAPSMKAVFDHCMTALTLLCEANLELETLRREAFKPTTPHLYKSLNTKPGDSKTLLFGDSMEDQIKSLENKEKIQKALEQEKALFKKTWASSSTSTKRHKPYGKAAPTNRESKNGKGFPKIKREYHFRETSLLQEEVVQHHHHHSFNVSVPLKVGRTAPMFVLSFFLHSILFAGSALDSFQCLRSLLIVSFHVFFGLPRPRCPTTSNSVMLLIQPSFLTTCPNQCRRLYRNKVCMLLIPSFLRTESELMWSFKSPLHVHRIIARSLRCSLSRSLTLGAEHSLAYNKTVWIYVLYICPRVM